jgi:hypothetical protein
MNVEHAIRFMMDNPEHWLTRDIKKSVEKQKLSNWMQIELSKRKYYPEEEEEVEEIRAKCATCGKPSEVVGKKAIYCWGCYFNSDSPDGGLIQEKIIETAEDLPKAMIAAGQEILDNAPRGTQDMSLAKPGTQDMSLAKPIEEEKKEGVKKMEEFFK